MDNTYSDEDHDMSDTTTLEANSGGRVRFTVGAEVRYIEMAGTVSGVYLVEQERSDRKGHISLKERDGIRVVRVHHRRILPKDMDGKAVVIESQNKLWALCPTCGSASEVSPGDATTDCPKCPPIRKTLTLYWNGVKPMSEVKTKPEKAEKEPKSEKAPKAAPTKPKAEKPPKEPKPQRVTKTPVPVDLAALAKTANCELWTKSNVKFDHERIDVQAHILLFVGDNPRKLCFNTYNGALGRKDTGLPVTEFVANEPIKGVKNSTPWFPVPDLDKARAKIGKDGYELKK